MKNGLPVFAAIPLACLCAIIVSIILGFQFLTKRTLFCNCYHWNEVAIMTVVQNATDITGGARTTFPIIMASPVVDYINIFIF